MPSPATRTVASLLAALFLRLLHILLERRTDLSPQEVDRLKHTLETLADRFGRLAETGHLPAEPPLPAPPAPAPPSPRLIARLIARPIALPPRTRPAPPRRAPAPNSPPTKIHPPQRHTLRSSIMFRIRN